MNDRFGLETAAKLAQVDLSETSQDEVLRYVELLRVWQKAKNLVSKDTLVDVWTRHVADGLQLIPLIQGWCSDYSAQSVQVVDLGSGAGLPGMIVALGSADPLAKVESPKGLRRPILAVTLVEANGRKASFLRTVSRETGVPVTVLNKRIEAVHIDEGVPADIVTARALAPLAKLVDLAKPWMEKGATAFFHKGGEYARELEEWTDADAYDVVEHISVVDPNSRILQISGKMRRDQG
ncbi:MAG: 16S rRNA (guanine(527)-N(7))-methyltransferase RsmG [Pseudomonadota bacterium]